MSTPIKSSGLFVEAAYGAEGVPGLSGVTGGGEVHDLAWKAALADAKSQLPAVASHTGEPTIATPQVQSVPLVSDSVPGMAQAEMKTEHPLSWDRLSMTVASMVAWSMQVDVADDVIAQPVDYDDGGGVSTVEALLQGSGEFGTVEDLVGSEPGSVLSVEGSSETPQADDASPFLPEELLNEVVDQIEKSKISVPMGAETTGLKPDVLSETKRADSGQQEIDNRTEVEVLRTPGMSPETLGGSVPQAEDALTSVHGSEGLFVSQTLATETQGVTPVELGVRAGDPVDQSQGSSRPSALTGKNTEDFPHQKVILKVNSSSVKSPAVESGMVRLEAIKAALNELDTQAAIRNQAAAFHDTLDKPTDRTVSLAPTAARKDLIGKGQPASAPIQAHKARSNELGVSTPKATESASPIDPDVTSTEQPRQPDLALGKHRETATHRDAVRSAQVQPAPTQASADFTAAQTGAVNAEITSDQDTMTQVAKVDAEHIEAGEVPELPVSDPSHLDIDVDDPAGTVRVTMTKDAEEVTVRMETPQQVLEEYQDMESDLEKALAMQGLDLTNFDASEQEANQDEAHDVDASQSDQKESSGEVQPGVRDLEQSGDTARLVNRIV